jgi:hypothetical protein
VNVNLKGLSASLTAHTVFLQALAATHPDRAHLKYVFERLMSRLIADEQDPQVSGVLSSFEETLRAMLDGPGISKPPPGYRPPP